MKAEDFYELKIGQKIYYKGDEKTISSLCLETGGQPFISFNRQEYQKLSFLAIMKDLSLEPPKPKKRYWKWRAISTYGICKTTCFLDENGRGTVGEEVIPKENLLEKYENDFIEV